MYDLGSLRREFGGAKRRPHTDVLTSVGASDLCRATRSQQDVLTKLSESFRFPLSDLSFLHLNRGKC